MKWPNPYSGLVDGLSDDETGLLSAAIEERGLRDEISTTGSSRQSTATGTVSFSRAACELTRSTSTTPTSPTTMDRQEGATYPSRRSA